MRNINFAALVAALIVSCAGNVKGCDFMNDDGYLGSDLEGVYGIKFPLPFDKKDMRAPLTTEQIEHIQSVYSFLDPKTLAKELKVDLDQVKSVIKAHKKSLKRSSKKRGGAAAIVEDKPSTSKRQKATHGDGKGSFLSSAKSFKPSSADDFDLPDEFELFRLELEKSKKRAREMEDLFEPECTDDEDHMPVPESASESSDEDEDDVSPPQIRKDSIGRVIKTGRVWTKEEKKEIKALRKKGKTLKEIGQKFVVDQRAISHLLNPEQKDADRERARLANIKERQDPVKREKHLLKLKEAYQKRKEKPEYAEARKASAAKTPTNFDVALIEKIQERRKYMTHFIEIMAMDERLEGLSKKTLERLLDPSYLERLKTNDQSTGGIKGFKKPFSDSEVRDMKLLNKRGLSLISIGMIYGVRHGTIRLNLNSEVRAQQYDAVKAKKPTMSEASKKRRREKERERDRIRKETDEAYAKRRKDLADIQNAKRKEKKALEAPKDVQDKKPEPLKKFRYADASFTPDFIEAMQVKSLEGASFGKVLEMDPRLEGISAYTINRLLDPVFLHQLKTGEKPEKEKTTHGKAKGVKFIGEEIEDMRLLNERDLSFAFLGKIYGVGHETIRRHVDEEARTKSRAQGNARYERIKEDSEAYADLRALERQRDAHRKSTDPEYAERKAQQLRDLNQRKKQPQNADV